MGELENFTGKSNINFEFSGSGSGCVIDGSEAELEGSQGRRTEWRPFGLQDFLLRNSH